MIAAWLASIALFAPLPSNVNVIVAPCPEVAHASCAEFDQQTVYIDPDNLHRDTLAHELGHLWDMQHLTDEVRARWVWPTGAWYFANLADFDSGRVPGGEAFADAYMMCTHSFRWRKRHRVGLYNERFKASKVAQTCWLLRHPPVVS